MEISQIIQKFTLEKPNSILEIYIGKNLNRQMFNINNKIFFDVFYNYLIKNGWNIQDQFIMKSIHSKNTTLESILNREISNLFDFELPFSSNSNYYCKIDSVLKKFKGTYYDLLCNYYVKQPLQSIDFQKNVDSIYNETIEEISILHKKSTPFTIHLIVEKNSPSLFSYSVKIVTKDSISDTEPLNELFEIIDLAMAKYKKTDKTIASIFTPLN